MICVTNYEKEIQKQLINEKCMIIIMITMIKIIILNINKMTLM